MRLVIQRVTKASVEVENEVVGDIQKGFLVLVGIGENDNTTIVDTFAKKLCALRIFEDENGKMNKNIKEVGGKLLLVSQFTLYASCEHGNRPSFIKAAKQDKAKELYEYFIERCREQDVDVECGIFGADMQVSLINDGPVTIILE